MGGRFPSHRLGTAAVLAALVTAAVSLIAADDAAAQDRYRITAPSGEALVFQDPELREMLERTRQLRDIMERDPRVLYRVGTGPPVTDDEPGGAYPWRAVRVQSDSVARIATPANYREANRAYFNYAVRKMHDVRNLAPAARCEVAMDREVERISAFVEGWIVARTLFGGPRFIPLDAFVFAREAGHLPAKLVALRNPELDGCRERWRRDNPDAIEAYERWHREEFLGWPAEPALPEEDGRNET